MIQTRQLRYSYSKERTFDFPDIHCEAGKSLLVLGPSGCGKSTLLHLLCGLIKPQSGSIKILDSEIVNMNASMMDSFRGKHIGVVLQKPYFISSLTVKDNLLLFQSLSSVTHTQEFIVKLMNDLGLKGKENQKPQTLSQGEAQRLSFARALIHKPSLILADEPTSALDDKNAANVAAMLQAHAESVNAALIIVTHDKRLQSIFKTHIEIV
jgi:ABC-type lipoprotein export system ATPase subunit